MRAGGDGDDTGEDASRRRDEEKGRKGWPRGRLRYAGLGLRLRIMADGAKMADRLRPGSGFLALVDPECDATRAGGRPTDRRFRAQLSADREMRREKKIAIVKSINVAASRSSSRWYASPECGAAVLRSRCCRRAAANKLHSKLVGAASLSAHMGVAGRGYDMCCKTTKINARPFFFLSGFFSFYFLLLSAGGLLISWGSTDQKWLNLQPFSLLSILLLTPPPPPRYPASNERARYEMECAPYCVGNTVFAHRSGNCFR